MVVKLCSHVSVYGWTYLTKTWFYLHAPLSPHFPHCVRYIGVIEGFLRCLVVCIHSLLDHLHLVVSLGLLLSGGFVTSNFSTSTLHCILLFFTFLYFYSASQHRPVISCLLFMFILGDKYPPSNLIPLKPIHSRPITEQVLREGELNLDSRFIFHFRRFYNRLFILWNINLVFFAVYTPLVFYSHIAFNLTRGDGMSIISGNADSTLKNHWRCCILSRLLEKQRDL